MISPHITAIVVVRYLQLTEPKSNLKGFNKNTTAVENRNKCILCKVCIQILFISFRR